MKKLWMFSCMLLLANVCYAAAIKSNGTGGGKWSAPGTWTGGAVPGNGDSVTVQANDTVTFDVNQASLSSGIAGLTCDGTMNCSTSAGTYHLKTSADIGGTGTINCGSSGKPYPSSCTMTFDFNSTQYSFRCGWGYPPHVSSGLTLNLFCTEPTHPVIALSGTGAAGQTKLSVDTDVRRDIWAAGKTIRIDDANGLGYPPDSEAGVIAVGGIASGTITVRTGLTKAKASGAKVILVTRNIRIIGSTAYAAVENMVGGVLGCEISSCSEGVYNCSGSVIFGTMSGLNDGVITCSGCTISGTISGLKSEAVVECSGCTISGTISGCSSGVYRCSGCTTSGTISGCYSGVATCPSCVISGTISGCHAGVWSGSYSIHGATFSGNEYDLRDVVSASAYRTTFGSATEDYEYDTNMVPQWGYVASYDHNGVAGAFKAWTRGGVIVSDANMAPGGYGISYRHMCASGAMPCFRQESITVEPNQTLLVQGKILIQDNHSAWPPRLELIDPGADPLVDATKVALASHVIPSPNGRLYWQGVAVSYTNTGTIGRPVWIRCSAQRSGGDVYEVWSTHLQD